MPGSSLWLIPPPSHAFTKSLQNLISDTIPSHFPAVKTHNFIPHITLTSNVPLSSHSSDDPQSWLQGLDLPISGPIEAATQTLDPGVPFFKKLTISIGKSDGLARLAEACRAKGVLDGDEDKAHDWVEKEYLPHLSLMYADMPKADVSEKQRPLEIELQKARSQLSIESDGIVCKGGAVVLVPTDRPINEWNPIAEVEVPGMEWIWPTAISR